MQTYQKAYEYAQQSAILCGSDCTLPPTLDWKNAIDLKDGISDLNGKPILLYKNPAKIIHDEYLNDYYQLCVFADNGHLPQDGGVLNQSTEFLEFFQIYLNWKNIKKIEKNPQQSQK